MLALALQSLDLGDQRLPIDLAEILEGRQLMKMGQALCQRLLLFLQARQARRHLVHARFQPLALGIEGGDLGFI